MPLFLPRLCLFFTIFSPLLRGKAPGTLVRCSGNTVERHTSEWKFQSRASPTRSQKYVASIATMPIVRNTGILNLDQMPKRFEMNLNRVSLIEETYADVLQTWTAKDLSVVSLLQDKIKKKEKRKKDRGRSRRPTMKLSKGIYSLFI